MSLATIFISIHGLAYHDPDLAYELSHGTPCDHVGHAPSHSAEVSRLTSLCPYPGYASYHQPGPVEYSRSLSVNYPVYPSGIHAIPGLISQYQHPVVQPHKYAQQKLLAAAVPSISPVPAISSRAGYLSPTPDLNYAAAVPAVTAATIPPPRRPTLSIDNLHYAEAAHVDCADDTSEHSYLARASHESALYSIPERSAVIQEYNPHAAYGHSVSQQPVVYATSSPEYPNPASISRRPVAHHHGYAANSPLSYYRAPTPVSHNHIPAVQHPPLAAPAKLAHHKYLKDYVSYC